MGMTVEEVESAVIEKKTITEIRLGTVVRERQLSNEFRKKQKNIV